MNLRDLPYVCKASNWRDVKAIPAFKLPKTFPYANILGSTPCANFTATAPAHCFVATNEFGTFLINTEGYQYARYALRLDDGEVLI
jgi:hypothetical protein